MPAAMNQITIPKPKPGSVKGQTMDHSKIHWINNPNVRCNDKFISLHNLKPSNSYQFAVKTKNHPKNTQSVMTPKNVRINDKSAGNENDFPMWLNLRQKYGTASSTPPSNTGAPLGAGNTPNGVPAQYQYYLPSIISSLGDYEWDRLDKTKLDLVSTGNNYFQPPSNPNPVQSYYGIYDSAVKKKIEAMKSPNMNIG